MATFAPAITVEPDTPRHGPVPALQDGPRNGFYPQTRGQAGGPPGPNVTPGTAQAPLTISSHLTRCTARTPPPIGARADSVPHRADWVPNWLIGVPGNRIAGRKGARPAAFASVLARRLLIWWEPVRDGKDSAMASFGGEIIIGLPADVVFDYVADQRNEPRYNPKMVRAEKITGGPVGQGTRFRSAVASGGREMEMLIECAAFDRPKLYATVTTMRRAQISYTLTFEPVTAGTRMRWHARVRPAGVLRLADPLIAWLGARQERRIWTSLRHQLEAGPPGPARLAS